MGDRFMPRDEEPDRRRPTTVDPQCHIDTLGEDIEIG